MIKDKFKTAHMEVAEVYSRLSSCNRLKVGSVIVKGDRIISIGYNGTPPGKDNCCEDENGLSKQNVRHAEWNALQKLEEAGESCEGAAIFITHCPCKNCAEKIKDAGIKEVYYKEEYRDNSGIELLKKCGLYVEKV